MASSAHAGAGHAGPHDLSDEVAGDWKPWPAAHVPATAGERRMWRAFASVRDTKGMRLTPRAIGRRTGMSPTPIAHDGGAYVELRKAIVAEMTRRKPSPPPPPDPAAVAEAEQKHRESRITYWQKVAQQADAINAEYEARAIRAEEKTVVYRKLAKRILTGIQEGRIVVNDPDQMLLAELFAALGPPSKTVEEVDDGDVE